MNVRRLLLALLFLAACAGHAVAQDPDQKDAREANELTITPLSPIVFPCTPFGESDTVIITLSNNEDRPVHTRGYEIEKGPVGLLQFIPGEGNADVKSRGTRKDTIIYTPKSPFENFGIDVRLHHGSSTRFRVLVASAPPAKLGINPDSLIFETHGPGETVERCAIIYNPSCDPIIITDLKVAPPYELVSPTPLPDTIGGLSRDQLCIRLPAGPQPNGTEVARIETSTNQIITVRLRARRLPRPNIIVRPQNLTFDSVPANSTSGPLFASAINTGNLPDGVDGWRVTGPDSSEFIVIPPSLPAPLPPQANDSAVFAVRFTPRDPGPHQAVLELHFANSRDVLEVHLFGKAIEEAIQINIHEVDMGEVYVGESVTYDTLTLRNVGTKPVTVAGIDFTAGDSSFFTILDPGASVIPAAGRLTYSIRFTPDAVREYEADAVVRLSNGGRIPVKLRGGGDTRPPKSHRVWIDSTRTLVNVPFDLIVHADPAFNAADSVTRFKLVFRVDYRSLFPHGPVSRDGARDTLYYLSPDTIVVERLEGPVIAGSDLIAITFEGLVTGQFDNTVELVDVQFPGRSVSISTSPGRVLLDGCDVGSGLGFNRPIAAHRAWPVPAAGDVTISYTAPLDSRPWVRITNLMGRTILQNELPSGTGGEQRTTVGTVGLPAGTYFVELHAGSEMSVVRVIVGE